MEEKVSASSWPFMNARSIGFSLMTKLTLLGMAYGWGYMNWSIGWLIAPILLTVWNSEARKDREFKRLTAQAAAMANEKELIRGRVDQLPSWVFFPDFDRVEWLNKVLYNIWPNVNHYTKVMLKDIVEPSVVTALAEYKMKGFQFERMVLGRIPPKIYGIKAYDLNISRNEIILDADIMYAGDCDITFWLGNVKAGITDFQLRGMARIVLKPLLRNIPFVGGVQVFFLNIPNIDFNLTGAADFLDLPGLSAIVRKIITQQVAARIVLPNKIAVSLNENVPIENLKTPEPEGILRVHVIEAKDLEKKDIGVLGKGKSDPYAVINLGAQEHRTKTIDNTINPKWDHWCEFIVEQSTGPYTKVVLHLFDKDNTGEDDPLGSATIEVARVKKHRIVDDWISLEFAKHGIVHVRLTWLDLTKNVSDLPAAIKETQLLRVTSMSTAVLILYIDSAQNLPRIRGSKQPDVYLEANVGSKMERTITMLRCCDPVWEQGFSFLVGNPATDTLHVKLLDQKTGTNIGKMTYNLSNLMEEKNLEIREQPFNLGIPGHESKIVMSMTLRILKYENPETINSESDEGEQNSSKKLESQESFDSVASVPRSPLKKQASKESVHSLQSIAASAEKSEKPIEMVDSAKKQVEEESDDVSVSFVAREGLTYRTPSTTSFSGESKLGRILLSVGYSVPRQRLTVVVHRIARLPLPSNDPSNIPDPYVKLYLLPDRAKDSKRKTSVKKDNCSPEFNEEFEYVISQGDLNTKQLDVSVCTYKTFLQSGKNVIGKVVLKLSELDLEQSADNPIWYDLVPENKE